MNYFQSQYKQVTVNKEFSLRIPNGREITIQLNENANLESLTLFLCSSTSYPDPQFKVIDVQNRIIKIFFDTRYPLTATCSFYFSDSSSVIVKESIGFWKKLSPVVKKTSRFAALTVATTLLGGVLIYADKKHNDSSVGNWWKSISVFGVADSIEEIDGKVLTNNHPVYKTDGFLEIQEDLSEDEGKAINLKGYYWYAGNELFAFKKLVRGKKGQVIKVPYEIAEDFCEKIGGTIPSKGELDKILSGKIARVTDFVLPIEAERSVPEWTRDELGGDHYLVYMKGATKPPAFAESIAGQIAGEEDDSSIAFRCVMYTATFLEAE